MRPRFLGETLRMRVGRWCGSSGRALVSRYAAGKVLGRTLIDQMQSFQHRFQRPFTFCSISTIRIRSKSRLPDSEYFNCTSFNGRGGEIFVDSSSSRYDTVKAEGTVLGVSQSIDTSNVQFRNYQTVVCASRRGCGAGSSRVKRARVK